MKQGRWMDFYDNGAVRKDMYYVNDILEGVYKEYDEIGRIFVSLKYEEMKAYRFVRKYFRKLKHTIQIPEMLF